MMLAHCSKTKKEYNRGVSLIEVVLALALFAGVVAGILTTRWGIENQFFNTTRTIWATNFAGLKLTNNIQDYFLSKQSVAGELSIDSKLFGQPFARCEMLNKVQSSWQTGWHSTSTATASLLIADLDRAQKYGYDCGGHSKIFGHEGGDGDLDESLELVSEINIGYPITGLDIVKNQFALSLRPVLATDPNFAYVNWPDIDQISFLNSPDAAGALASNKIDSVENFSFVARNSTTTQVAIIDTRSPSDLVEIATTTLPNVSGSRPEGFSIFYFDSRLYVGTKRTAGHEFHIFDVSNPASPVWLGSRELNHNINDISVVNGFAFLATSGNVRDLIILDVREPTSIVPVAEIDLPGNEDGKSIYIAGNKIFLGRYKSTVTGRNELWVFDYEIDEVGGIANVEISGSASTGADINNLSFASGSVLAATSNSSKELQIFGLNKLENQNDTLKIIASKNLPENASAIDVENEIVAVSAGQILYIFKQIK